MVVLRQDLVGHGQGIGKNVDGPEDADRKQCRLSGEDRNENSNGEWGAGQAGDEHSGNFEIRRMNRTMEVSNNLLNSRNAASDKGMMSDRMIPRRPGSVHRND